MAVKEPFIVTLVAWLQTTQRENMDVILKRELQAEIDSGETGALDKIVSAALPKVQVGVVDSVVCGPAGKVWITQLFAELMHTTLTPEILELTELTVQTTKRKDIKLDGTFLGNAQDPNTVVPAVLSTEDLEAAFKALGAVKIEVESEIDPSQEGHERTAYQFQCVFHLRGLVSSTYGPAKLLKYASKLQRALPLPRRQESIQRLIHELRLLL